MIRTTVIAAAISVAAIGSVQAQDASVPYPAGYRNWHHVKSMIINPGHPLYNDFGGIHHIYANKQAVTGYKSGKFPTGSVIVFDLLEARSADNTVVEGNRKVVGVMRKDAKKYAATGGWGYEGFKGDSTTDRAVGKNAAAACHGCHAGQQAKDYVFSALRR